MYWGGQAVRIILAAIIGPKFYYMTNTIDPSANVQTVDLVSFFIFVLLLGMSKFCEDRPVFAKMRASSGAVDQA